jgi:hypothetical protein
MTDTIPADVKQKLLNDPSVQAEINKQAHQMGKDAADALKDSAVQQKILDVAKEKFPEYAGKVGAKMQEFCADPEVQQYAKQFLGTVGTYAYNAGGQLVATIEQGPVGVRLLSACAGIMSCVNAVLTVMSPLSVFTKTVSYVLATYQMIFAVTTVMFEAPPEWVANVKGFHEYQELLMAKASFLKETSGRGIFYIFQGTLWLSFVSDMTKVFELASGLSMIFVGAMNLLIHFGGFQTFSEKVRSGYDKLQGSPPPTAASP